MGPPSTSEQEPRARLSLRDARFANWQFSSKGHVLAKPGSMPAGRLRTPYEARSATPRCSACAYSKLPRSCPSRGSQSPGARL